MTDEKIWDVVSLLKTSAEHFKQKSISEPRLNAEHLLAFVLGMKRLELYLAFDRPVSNKELTAYRELAKRRLTGEPLQYILGEQNFYGLDFKVDRRVLIPRSETELLVENLIDKLPKSPQRILDIGTGSGCIAITLVKMVSECEVTAVDVSDDALAVAKANATLHGAHEKINFVSADALDKNFASSLGAPFNAIVSNPPYIPAAEKDSLQPEVRDHEPPLALFTQTGFEFYEKIAADAQTLLTSGGVLAFELHADGSEKVKAILEQNGFTQIELKNDYAGLPRMAFAIKA
jgi:release factor glutamine methyltransferase